MESAISDLERLNKGLEGLVANMRGDERLEEFDITPTLEASKELVGKARSEVKGARSTKDARLDHFGSRILALGRKR